MTPLKKSTLLIAIMIMLFSVTAYASDLTINRMRIYFSNNRPEITIQRNFPLKVYAEIGYSGTGLLEGYWEVDDEFLANVIRTIASGDQLHLESPDLPPIPTFVSGTHKIRLILTKPLQNIQFPWAIYFVTTDEWKSSGTQR